MVQLNDDELTWPTWLDSSFFTKALRTYKHDQTVEVKSFEIAPGSAMGEHFSSIMFKASVVFVSKKYRTDDEKIDLVMKLLPIGDNFKAAMASSSMFKNEIRMYTSIIPEMERILEEAGEKICFAPPLIYQSLHDHPSPVIILKDVRPDGYTVPPWGVDSYETVKAVAKIIARFHAASMQLFNLQGADFDFGQHYFIPKGTDKESIVDVLMKPAFVKVAKDLGQVPKFETVSELLIKNVDRYFDTVKKSYDPTTECGYKVLNHGDFHSKNLLIRNGGQIQEDVLLIDYQDPIYSTPAIDVYHLLNLMTNPEIRAKHREEILRIYFSEFSDTLKKIGYRGKTPTLLDYRVELIQWSAIDLIQSLGMVGMQFVDMSKFDFNKLATDPEAAMSEIQQFITESDNFKLHVQDSVKRLQVKGTLGH